MNTPIPIVRIILQNEKGEVLFLKRKNTKHASGKWCLPGGKINPGQKAEEACISEAKEETNLDISNIKFLFFRDNLPVDDTELHCLVLYFRADFSGKIKINKESSEFLWAGFDALSRLDIAFSQKEIVKNALCSS
jgi:8-oxo-dGTP pyrophosphatase MutT (NUDIX family)